MDGGAWLAIVHGVAKSRTRLSEFTSQVALVVKNPLASAGDARDVGLIPGLGRYTGAGNGNALQCSYLENFMVRGAWWDCMGLQRAG